MLAGNKNNKTTKTNPFSLVLSDWPGTQWLDRMSAETEETNGTTTKEKNYYVTRTGQQYTSVYEVIVKSFLSTTTPGGGVNACLSF